MSVEYDCRGHDQGVLPDWILAKQVRVVALKLCMGTLNPGYVDRTMIWGVLQTIWNPWIGEIVGSVGGSGTNWIGHVFVVSAGGRPSRLFCCPVPVDGSAKHSFDRADEVFSFDVFSCSEGC